MKLITEKKHVQNKMCQAKNIQHNIIEPHAN